MIRDADVVASCTPALVQLGFNGRAKPFAYDRLGYPTPGGGGGDGLDGGGDARERRVNSSPARVDYNVDDVGLSVASKPPTIWRSVSVQESGCRARPLDYDQPAEEDVDCEAEEARLAYDRFRFGCKPANRVPDADGSKPRSNDLDKCDGDVIEAVTTPADWRRKKISLFRSNSVVGPKLSANNQQFISS